MKNNRLFIVVLILWAIGGVIEINLAELSIGKSNIGNIQRVFSNKEKKATQLLNELRSSDEIRFEEALKVLDNNYKEEGIAVLIYKNDTLSFWSNNSIVAPRTFSESEIFDGLCMIKNAWFYTIIQEQGDYQQVGLIHLKNNYPFENKFLQNTFQNDFNISKHFAISDTTTQHSFNVYNQSNRLAFSIFSDNNKAKESWYVNISVILYFIGILLFLIASKLAIQRITSFSKRNWSILLFGILLAGIRLVMVKLKFPYVFYMLELFSPFYFAHSTILPSLGDLLFTVLFIFFFFYVFYSNYKLAAKPLEYSASKRRFLVILSFTLLFAFNWLVINLFYHLINNSNVLFDVNKLFHLSIYSLIGIIVLSLLMASIVLFSDKLIQLLKLHMSHKHLILYALLIAILFSLVFWLSGAVYAILGNGLIFLILLVIIYIRFHKNSFDSRNIVFIILLVSLFSVFFIAYHSVKKEKEVRKVLVVNLANERDAVAEMLLESYEEQIKSDTNIRSLLFDSHELQAHIQNQYFGGYWNKYEFQLVHCWPEDSLFINNTEEMVHCNDFFENMLLNEGVKLSVDSDFYFIDNMNGRISYLGKFTFYIPEMQQYKNLFISLDSKLVSEEMGYPELLLEEKLTRKSMIDDYSYAKYRFGKLEMQKGDFNYNHIMNFDIDASNEFSFRHYDGYDHLIYNLGNDNQIVISRQRVKFVDIVVSFSYLFIFFYIMLSAALMVINNPHQRKGFGLSLKNRITYSMVAVVIISLLIVGSGSIYFTIRQFENKHYENMSEKIQSVLIELEHKIGIEESLEQEDVYFVDFLTQLLKKFSQVFYTDINVYDLNGELLASSLPEIFDKGLIGNRMAPNAFYEVAMKQRAQYINREHVGNMSYLSIYVPFYNYEGELLAYLNLPYFTKQSDLRDEIVTLAVTIINIYSFLIVLTIALAIFVSNKITKPLRLVQEKLRKITLGTSNELIEYGNDDEIGKLVQEYNKKVIELADSAKKLAASERESAWREMAKQIAHEIKNPLTPMKLNVQHFQRMWKQDIPDKDAKMENFAKALIAQIDNLSAIATEFSNFAKLPEIKIEKVDLIERLRSSLRIFETMPNTKFKTNLSNLSSIYVYTDNEQIIQVFNNLIKNAVQSIPKGRQAVIELNITKKSQAALVEVRDNGSGIPEELHERMFEPNFTTKSSGMGIGLALSKNIIESCNGRIWYATQAGEGTSFFVELPVFNEK